MSVSFKDYLEKMYTVFDNIDRAGIGIMSFEPSLEFNNSKELIQSDLIFFVLYLSASDREISYKEKWFISENLDVDFTVEEMKEIIRGRKLRSAEFERNIPLSVKMMVDVDNKIVAAGTTDSKGSFIIYDLFKNVGQALLACDDDVDEKEIGDMARYLDMIKTYINATSISSLKLNANPLEDSRDSKKLLKEIKPQKINYPSDNTTSNYHIGANNPSNPAPWDNVYYDFPCPYCGKYKTRPSKWEDKMLSTAFWGFYSYKLHCRFKCDNCGRMWN